MIHFTKTGDIYTHKCVKCGITIQYDLKGAICCPHCRAPQRLKSRITSIPFYFIDGPDSDYRIWYHNEITNV